MTYFHSMIRGKARPSAAGPVRLALLVLLSVLCGRQVHAQEFKEVPFEVGAVANFSTTRGNASFLDFDNDGDLDVMTAGPGFVGAPSRLRVYRNTGGHYILFSDFAAAGASASGGAAWADINKNGYGDLVTWIPMTVPGGSQDSGRVQFFGYDPGTDSFQPTTPPVNVDGILSNPLFEFSDYDLDGYPDLLVAGWRKPDRVTAQAPYTRILHNADGLSLMDTVPFPTPTAGAVTAWNDIDDDGDLDLFLAGSAQDGGVATVRSSRIFLYDRALGQFTLFQSLGLDFDVKSAAMADYTLDGLGDLAVCGKHPRGAITRLYWHNGTVLEEDTWEPFIDTSVIPNADLGSVSFGDADRDGDPDILVSGEYFPNAENHFTYYYENSGGFYYERDAKLPPFWNSLARFVDADKDGNPDIFLSGTTTNPQGQTSFRAQLYRNIRGDFDVAISSLSNVTGKRARWGDYDNDGDMDLVTCGATVVLQGSGRKCALYNNQAGAFSVVPTPFDGLYGDPEWGDHDGDGRIDLLLAGSWGVDGRLRLFRNTGGGFVETALEDDLVQETAYQNNIAARWGDFNRDGHLDILAWGRHAFSGFPLGKCFSEVLLNKGGNRFERIASSGMPGVCNGELEWGDHDKDGDLDVLLSGDTVSSGTNTSFTGVYRNDGGVLHKTADKFLGLSSARASWGDFDGDGDLDFAIAGSDFRSGATGSPRNVPTTWIYRLVDGSFEEYWKGAGLIGDVAWIDYDNDGDLDLINSGRYFVTGTSPQNVNMTLVLRNNGLVNAFFEPFNTLHPETNTNIKGELDVADYDNDGDADFLVAGQNKASNQTGDGITAVRLYKNTLASPNTRPAAPSGLSVVLGQNRADLSWGAGSDAETKEATLQYNVRVGTSPGAADVLASAAEYPSGSRLLPGQANAGHARSLRVQGLAFGTYYWSVQTVDMQGGASAFASEGSFTLGLPAPTMVQALPGPGQGTVTLAWNRLSQSHFKGYIVHGGLAPETLGILDTLFDAQDTVLAVRNLANGVPWHFRVSAMDQGGNLSPPSNTLSAVTDGTAPAIPSGVAATPNDRSITLSWNANTEADFLSYLVYQRNASGPVVKIDSIPAVGTTSMTITGLKNGTPYSFLIVAVDTVLNYSSFSEEAVAIPAYLLTPSTPAIAFGKAALGGHIESGLTIRNSSDLPVPVDSVRFVNTAFHLAGSLSSFPASAETTLTLTFDPNRPAGGDFTGVFRIFYGGSAVPLEIDMTGSATALPYCSIDQIVPGDLAWDTSTAISFLARANDSDNAGEGDRIVSYLWSSSLAGPLEGNASGFTLKPGQLGLGTHAITLRVVDNEGDTSLPAQGSVTIRSIKPLVRIKTITPAGLIIRGADQVRIQCAAHDLDEGAGPDKPDLASFQLVSTLQGVLSAAQDTTLASTSLTLGLHGFYARATDDEGDIAISDTVWVPVQADVGLALLVAGTDFNDNRYFYENIAPNCNWAYSQLRQRGFTDSMITYFNPVGWQSIGGDYHKDSRIVDETEVTVAKLRERILGFKARVRNGVPLLLSFIGHGGRSEQNGKFYLSPEEYLSPDSLDAWLDTYNQDEEGKVTDSIATPIVLVFDFCYSGTFFPKLRSSTQNRMVITSSSVDRQSYFNNGRSFSYALFRQVEKGGNLTEAFVAGRTWSDANATVGADRANPLANADNDNTSNESEDFLRMNTVYIGGSQQGQGPGAAWKDLQLQYDQGARTFRILAYPEGQAQVDKAWYTMLPPDFKVPKAGSVDPFLSGALDRQSDGTYSATVTLDPVQSGDYLFVVYGIKDSVELMPVVKRANPVPIPVGLARRSGIPDHFDLGLNYPNPAITHTLIPLAVTRYGRAEIKIYGMDGRLVKRLLNSTLVPGYYLMNWDGRDQAGRRMAPGLYTYTLQSGEGIRRRTMVWGR